MKALFIGLTTLDIQYFVDEYPSTNVKVKTEAPLLAAGGPAANAAITFAALGGQVDFYTCIGENLFAELLKNDLAYFGVNVFDQFRHRFFEPIVATIITATNSSERTIFTHHPAELNEFRMTDGLNVKNYDLIFTDGFYPELSLPLMEKAKFLEIPVVFDGGSWKNHLIKLLDKIDFAICSGNFQPPTCYKPADVIKYMHGKGIRNVAISQGENEIIADFGCLQIEKIKAVDSLGAGDALHGAFCWYYLQNKSFEQALQLAAKFASFSVQFKGTHCWMTSENLQNFSQLY